MMVFVLIKTIMYDNFKNSVCAAACKVILNAIVAWGVYRTYQNPCLTNVY